MSNQKHADTVSVFENPSIGRAVWTLAIPTVITQLINMIYNFADTWFVGRTGNAAMVAATNVCMPLFVIMAAIANLFGIGGARSRRRRVRSSRSVSTAALSARSATRSSSPWQGPL